MFTTHGSKRPIKQLIDRDRTKGPQGQWKDELRAANYLATLSHGIDKIVIKRIPRGMGRVVTDSGEIIEASYAFIKPSSTGIRSAFPVLENHKDFKKYFIDD